MAVVIQVRNDTKQAERLRGSAGTSGSKNANFLMFSMCNIVYSDFEIISVGF